MIVPGDMVVSKDDVSEVAVFEHVNASSERPPKERTLEGMRILANYKFAASTRVGWVAARPAFVVAVPRPNDPTQPVQITVMTTEGSFGWCWSDYVKRFP